MGDIESGQKSTHPAPRLVFWELTRSCNLKCVHCRATPAEAVLPNELSTTEAKNLIEQIAQCGKCVVVLSGGEPLVRDDVYEVAQHAASNNLHVALATNATLVTTEIAYRLAACGIERVSVSIDGATADSHDSFRRVPGAFDAAWRGIEHILAAGIPFQINTTITRYNVMELPNILHLAETRGAVALHVFLLVPTGCAKGIPKDEILSPDEYERVLIWIHEQHKSAGIEVKPTCAPHYFRIAIQGGGLCLDKKPTDWLGRMTKGCLAGTGVCFISHVGEVYPCGYLPVFAGNIREIGFGNIWKTAEIFQTLRDERNLRGKCGQCKYKRICMGCRARAYAETGDYLGEEPYCAYKPGGRNQGE